MNHTDSTEGLAASREEVEQLRTELRASERQLARLLEMFEEQHRQVNSQQATLVRVERILMNVVTGRLWRTLRAVGGVVNAIIPGQAGQRRLALNGETVNGANGHSGLIARRNTHLTIDEPNPHESRPRHGKITVRGWAAAEGGVDSVRIEVAGLPPIETKPCIPRPDVQKSLPNLDKTGRSGFVAHFDSKELASGRHPILLRALVKSVVVREARTYVDIDHDKGFASDYQRWIHEFERPDSQIIELKVSSFPVQPKISIVTPVYNTRPEQLEAAIDSVLCQSYGHWELCISDDASTEPAVRQILERYAALDPRIKVHYATEQGGISRASNAAWRMTTGDFIALLDHDDTLAPNALAYVCEAINHDPRSDLFYSDEDKIDERGSRFDPFFKPDWSPDLFLSENYVCHLLVLRRDLAGKLAGFNLGGFNPAFDGSQDYDLILRASEQASRIQHIPKVLYHWRATAASTASGIENKSYAIDAARRALQDYCDCAKAGSTVEQGAIPGRWRVRYPVTAGTRVSIIIPSGGKADLRANLDSLFGKTLYPDYEVVIADNSKGNAIEKLVSQYQAKHANLRYIDWRNRPFNFSAINNTAARQCDSPLLLFLNDDTSVIEVRWLEAMVELALRPEVGAVGAKLLYPNEAIQHAGVVLGLFDNCGHAFKGLNGKVGHYFDFSDVIRNVSAVTGACLMTRAHVFWQVGGFDETQFAVAFNDVDLCLKMGACGYRVLYTPHAVLYHHESLSKSSKDLIPHPEEVEAMKCKWDQVIAHDPYYSPNLTRVDEDYSLRTRV
jgi:GT2 family glycosyltransferase